MARPIDADFLNQLRTYLKKEWMVNGQRQFSKSLDQIAMDITGLPKEKIKSSLKNKIFNYLSMLENGGSIKIEKGIGSNPNKFSYVDDKMIENLSQTKEQCNNSIDDFVKSATSALQMGIDLNADLSQKLIAAQGEINFYKQALLSLENWGTDPNGVVMYRLKRGSELPTIIGQIEKEMEPVTN